MTPPPPPPPSPPPGFEVYLSPVYEPLIIDRLSQEVIGWGFRILKRIEEPAIAEALSRFGDIEFVHGTAADTDAGTSAVLEFGLVVHWITPEAVIEKYGALGEVEYGPRGGFKRVVYGTTPFSHRKMRPRSP